MPPERLSTMGNLDWFGFSIKMGVFVTLELSLNEHNSVNYQCIDKGHHFSELSGADLSYKG